MEKIVKITVVLYKNKKLSSGGHPIMFRIYKDRKAHYISTGYSSSVSHWNQKLSRPNTKHPKKIEIEAYLSVELKKLEKQMVEIHFEDKAPTSENVKERIVDFRAKISVFDFFDEVIDSEKQKGKIRTADCFKQAKNVLLAFTNKKTLQFPEIDVRFLLNYETYLRKRELKDTTLIFYIKTLRILYNRALSQRLFKVDNSAFNDFKISKFDKTTQHRALSEDDINSLKFLPIDDTSSLFLARNIFLFSFYTMGMSLIDVANLTWSNVLQDTNNGVVSYRIIYERSKTSKKINLKLTDKALEILDYYKGMKTDNYLFPILNSETDTPQKIYNRIRKQTVSINKDLKKLAKLCNIKMNLTTYVARHSCATTLKRKGVTTSIISEMLGHKNEMITQIYLDSFGNDVTDKAMDLL